MQHIFFSLSLSLNLIPSEEKNEEALQNVKVPFLLDKPIKIVLLIHFRGKREREKKKGTTENL